MKKVYFTVAVLLCFLFTVCLTACGKEEEQQYFDLQVEKKTFYDVAGANPEVYTSFLNMQFYQDKPVQIWAVYDGVKNMNVFLYRTDGSRQLLLENIPMEYARGGGYIDQEGNFYYWAVNQNSLIKADPSGNQLFSRPLSELGIHQIDRMYQLGNGRIYVKCMEKNEDALVYRLCGLDPVTGDIAQADINVSDLLFETYMAAGEDCLLCMTRENIKTIDMRSGGREEVWSFVGTSYDGRYNRDYPIWDFRVREDGSLEILEAGNLIHAKGADGAVKTLRKVVVGEGRKVVVMRGKALDEWIKGCARRFNEQSEEWYIKLEECGGDYELWGDYAKKTSVEIAAGKGPDILYGDVLMDYAYGVFEKGGFADLSPYLEASGLNKDDFFPCTFGRWQSGEKIYSVSAKISLSFITNGCALMDPAFLGGSRDPDIGTLVDAMLAHKEEAVFLRQMSSQRLLEWLLKGSEDLWGMVDWEKGTCDFGTGLFAGILEAAKRYEGVWKEKDARPSVAEADFFGIYEYQGKAFLEERGKVRVGFLFDDGSHPHAEDAYTMTVNVNSRKKDGAWEFIQYILEKEQLTQPGRDEYPASKKAFFTKMVNEKDKGLWRDGHEFYDDINAKTTYYSPLTNERIQELKEVLEDARFSTIRTQPILDIIYEEAGGYFSGTKEIDETIRVISNRVQLYLDENRS